MRTASLLHALAQRYEVDLITFREPNQPDPLRALPPGLVRRASVINLPVHSKRTAARVFRNLHRLARGVPPLIDRFAGFHLPLDGPYDVALVEHLWCAPYASLLRPHCAKLIIDLHNVESRLLASSSAASGFPGNIVLKAFSSLSRGYEHTWLPRYDAVLVCSTQDQAAIDRPSIVYPNSLPLRPQPCLPRRPVVAFSGNFDYQPNQTAIRYFAKEIWPEVHRRRPDVAWCLIGRNEAWAREFLKHIPGVKFTGSVDDPLVPLAAAQAAVVPLLSGSGTRIKILEAWAAGTPVISTPLGAEGLDAIPGEHYLSAASPTEFVRSTLAVLESGQLATKLSSAGRVLYEKRYTWNAVWQLLDESQLLSR